MTFFLVDIFIAKFILIRGGMMTCCFILRVLYFLFLLTFNASVNTQVRDSTRLDHREMSDRMTPDCQGFCGSVAEIYIYWKQIMRTLYAIFICKKAYTRTN